jgi:hydrophobic/amphiphilic exporter-1 (mainly G- bacteria), HAE1 family
LMSTLPITLGFRSGSAAVARNFGSRGLLFSQVVTLFLIPVVFVYLEQVRQWSAERFGKKRRQESAGEMEAMPVEGDG